MLTIGTALGIASASPLLSLSALRTSELYRYSRWGASTFSIHVMNARTRRDRLRGCATTPSVVSKVDCPVFLALEISERLRDAIARQVGRTAWNWLTVIGMIRQRSSGRLVTGTAALNSAPTAEMRNVLAGAL